MQQVNTPIRRHNRHQTGIPIEVTVDFRHTHYSDNDSISNVSHGGLCFLTSDRLDTGLAIQVRFPILDRQTSLDGRVVWCSKSGRGFEIGLKFDDPVEVESLKMIEQICQIENFRREVEKIDGRKLSGEQAAREWGRRYAGEFSALN